jgi:hypothetical protein
LSSLPDIMDGEPGSNLGGKVEARAISAISGEGGSGLGSVNDRRELLASACGREGVWSDDSIGRGDSKGVILVNCAGLNDDSEFRFESKDMYAES